MARILYVAVHERGIAGGHKMMFRHVEALRALGFDAACMVGGPAPQWFEHAAPIVGGYPQPGDIVVIAEDAGGMMRRMATREERTVVFAQNGYNFAIVGLPALEAFAPERMPAFLACAEGLAATVRRCVPRAQVDVVRCFADERLFAPGPAKRPRIACVPRKRPGELRAIRGFFARLHPRHADVEWAALDNVTEREVAATLADSAVFLSLSRLESVGMTPLEAMASDCVVAGFTGIGGRQYATEANGFWVGEDDCEAAADALAAAVDLHKAGGAPLRERLDEGRRTADQWSHAAFVRDLERAWMRLAPEARVSAGPI